MNPAEDAREREACAKYPFRRDNRFLRGRTRAPTLLAPRHMLPYRDTGAIIGTYQEKSGMIFWMYMLRQPLQENQIVAWKFCHVLHKILRGGPSESDTRFSALPRQVGGHREAMAAPSRGIRPVDSVVHKTVDHQVGFPQAKSTAAGESPSDSRGTGGYR